MKKDKLLFWFSVFHSFAVMGLIFFGALVKSHEAGLSVPDWPSTYGQNMFLYPWEKWKLGKVFYEHGHRLLASVIGIITIISAVLHCIYEKRKWVRNLSLISLVLVIIQGVFGGLTVLYQLPDILSVLHGITAQSFFILVVLITYFHSAAFKTNKFTLDKSIFRISLVTFIFIFSQLTLGAFMRHSESGIAVPDFPTVAGEYIPKLSQENIMSINQVRKNLNLAPVESWQIILHLCHRYAGFIVGFLVLFLSFKLFRTPFKKMGKLLSSLVLIEIALGITTIISVREPTITSFHVVIGALLLVTSAVTCARTYYETK